MDKNVTFLFMDRFLPFFNSLLFLWRWSLKCFQKIYTTPMFYFLFLILILNPAGQDQRRRFCLRPSVVGSLCRSTVSVWPSFEVDECHGPGSGRVKPRVQSEVEQGGDIAQTFTWTYFFRNFKNTNISWTNYRNSLKFDI